MWNSYNKNRIIKPCRELLQLQSCKVLNPQCLLQKINDVSQQIMQLQPIVQTNELLNCNTFQNWWRFYANGQKPRTYSELKRIWNANQRYEDRIKNPRAANFLKIFTKDDPEKLGKFYDKMYKNFESCFTSRQSCVCPLLPKVKRYRQRKVKPVEIVKVKKMPYKIYKISDVKSHKNPYHIGNGAMTTGMDFNLEKQKFKSKQLNKKIKRKLVKNEQEMLSEEILEETIDKKINKKYVKNKEKVLSEERLSETLDKKTKRKRNKNKKEVHSEEIVEEKLGEEKNGELTEKNLEENVKEDSKLKKRKQKFEKQFKNKVDGRILSLESQEEKLDKKIKKKSVKNNQEMFSEEGLEEKIDKQIKRKHVKNKKELLSKEGIEEKLDEKIINKSGEVTEHMDSNPQDTANSDRKVKQRVERKFEKKSKKKQEVIHEESRGDKLSENIEKKQVKSVSELGQSISFRTSSRRNSSSLGMSSAWGKQKLTRSKKFKSALDKGQQKQIEEKHSKSFETASFKLSRSHPKSKYTKPAWGSKSSSHNKHDKSTNNHFFKHNFIRPSERRTSSASIKKHMLSPKISVFSINNYTDWKKKESFIKIEESKTSIDKKTRNPYLTHIKIEGTRKSNFQIIWPSVKRQQELPTDVVKKVHNISSTEANVDFGETKTKSDSFKSDHSNVLSKVNEGIFSVLVGTMSLERVLSENTEGDNSSQISSVYLLKNYDIMIRYLNNIGFTFNSPNSEPRNWPLPFESDFLQQQRRDRRPIKRKFVNIPNSEQKNVKNKNIKDKTKKTPLPKVDQCEICFQIYHQEPDKPYMIDMRRKMKRIELNNYYKSKLLPKWKIPTKTKEKRNQPKKITIAEQGNRLEKAQSMRKNLDLCYEMLCNCQQIVDNKLIRNRCFERSMY